MFSLIGYPATFSNSFHVINAFGDPLAVLSPLVVLAISVFNISTYNDKNSRFFVRTILQYYFIWFVFTQTFL